jgi:hypothetical protein
VLTSILGSNAAKSCQYQYNFNVSLSNSLNGHRLIVTQSVGEFFDFSQRVTRYGESGIYGFLPLLENKALPHLVLLAVSTEVNPTSFLRCQGLTITSCHRLDSKPHFVNSLAFPRSPFGLRLGPPKLWRGPYSHST